MKISGIGGIGLASVFMLSSMPVCGEEKTLPPVYGPVEDKNAGTYEAKKYRYPKLRETLQAQDGISIDIADGVYGRLKAPLRLKVTIPFDLRRNR